MVDVAKPLAPFLRRPPTPPKDTYCGHNGLQSDLTGKPALDTPEESPSSSTEYFKDTSGKARKRVVISGYKQFYRPPDSSNKGYDSDDLRQLPPSRECKSARSILKQPIGLATFDGGSDLVTLDSSSLPIMLRSAAQHMACESRSSRLDAYNSLSACLSTYEDLPEPQELTENVVAITGFIKRDVSQRVSENTAVDIQLATQAIKLLITFVSIPNLAANVPDSFRHYIIDQAIASIVDHKSPKILVSHYLHLLEKQKFGPKAMTGERVNKLLTVLEDLTTRVKGARIVSHRLMIYQRLLGQARPVMATRVSSWIKNLIGSLLSSVRDVRMRAIHFGMDAALQLGTSNTVSQGCLDVVNSQSSEGKKLIDLLCARMTEMVNSKDEGQHVPQIWSVVILFLRSRRRQLESWEHMVPWIKLMEKCFNSGDHQIKYEAHIAWRRLIFALNIGPHTSPSITKVLKTPIVPLLERKSSEKYTDINPDLSKQHARATYCTLLYYAFRPDTAHRQLDEHWEMFVADILPKSFAASKSGVELACGILASLLSSEGQSRVWHDNKANMNGQVKTNELPSIDPKWIRSRVQRVMQVLDKLFLLAEWDSSGDQLSPVMLVWRSFMTALAAACSKEIKTSTETLNALAQIVNQIKRFTHRRCDGDVLGSEMLERTNALIEIAIDKLGILAFNEKRIVLTAQHSFEAASETPSGRLKMNPASLNSATYHLLRLILSQPIDPESLPSRSLVARLLLIATQSTHTRHGQLSLLRNLARMCVDNDDAIPSESRLLLWQTIGSAAHSALQMQRTLETYAGSPVHPGHEYRDTVKILELGFLLHSDECIEVWNELYQRLIGTLEEEIGAAGTALMVIEPLASVIHQSLGEQAKSFSLNAAVKVIEYIRWPQGRQLLERTQAQLWGTVPALPKSSASDLPDSIYSFITAVMASNYTVMSQMSSSSVVSLITAITSCIHSCPPSLRPKLLNKAQHGLAHWIEDAQELLTGPRREAFLQVKRMWAVMATVIEAMSESSMQILSNIPILVTASLRSRHKPIVNDAVVMWNRTFGCVETLEYPEDLKRVLLKLRSTVDIDVPGIPNSRVQESDLSPLRFVESQNNEADGDKFVVQAAMEPGLPLPRFGTPSKGRLSSRTPRSSPRSSTRRKHKTTPKARLRHDDSQVQFAAIESSPLAANEANAEMLTDRQREVKERQAADNAMFPEIRSSPGEISKRAAKTIPKLNLKSKSAPEAANDEHDNISPTFLDDSKVAEEFLGSSPTPSSSRHRSQERGSEDELPSSPPFVSSHWEVSKPNPLILGSPQRQPRDPENPLFRVPSKEAVENEGASSLPQPLQTVSPGPSHLDGKETNILSDQDVFVDAHSEPQATSDGADREASPPKDPLPGGAIEKLVNEMEPTQIDNSPESSDHQRSRSKSPGASRVITSFQGEQTSDPSFQDLENEQAAAQLVAEMEVEHLRRNSAEVAEASPRKRKPSVQESPRKRARLAATRHDGSRSTAAPSAGEAVADCVLIEARPAKGMFQSVSPEAPVKRECSESPTAATVLSMVAETPAPGRRRGRPAGGSQSSSQSRTSAKRKARKAWVKQEADEEDAEGSARAARRVSVPSRLRRITRNSPLSSDPLHGDESDARTGMDSPSMGVPQSTSRQHSSQSNQIASGKVVPTTDRGAPTAQGLLEGFRKLYDDLGQVVLGREEERAMVSVLFESVQRIHEAGRRYGDN